MKKAGSFSRLFFRSRFYSEGAEVLPLASVIAGALEEALDPEPLLLAPPLLELVVLLVLPLPPPAPNAEVEVDGDSLRGVTVTVVGCCRGVMLMLPLLADPALPLMPDEPELVVPADAVPDEPEPAGGATRALCAGVVVSGMRYTCVPGIESAGRAESSGRGNDGTRCGSTIVTGAFGLTGA
jgi:hypothetical protein